MLENAGIGFATVVVFGEVMSDVVYFVGNAIFSMEYCYVSKAFRIKIVVLA